jgi:hypothetical protein
MSKVVNKVIDGLVNPAVMSGFQVFAGQVNLDDTNTLTVEVPSKSIISAIGTCSAGSVTVTIDTSGTYPKAVFTKATDGILHYVIIASQTETPAVIDADTNNLVIDRSGEYSLVSP